MTALEPAGAGTCGEGRGNSVAHSSAGSRGSFNFELIKFGSVLG